MSKPVYNLIDVMRGIHKHGIIDKMSAECFTFFIGIVLEANEMGFKNPIDLTVSQSLSIGGGNSRQTLHGRRKSLANFRLEGKALVIVEPGNKGKNSLATYQIDYDLLCSYNSVWHSDEAAPSRIIDNSPHSSPYSTPHNSLTILRSEDLRLEGDKIPPTPINGVISGRGTDEISGDGIGGGEVSQSQNTESEQRMQDNIRYLQRQILHKYNSQISEMPEEAACRDVLREFGGDPKWLLAAINQSPALINKTPISALNLVRSVACRLRDAAVGGTKNLSPAKMDEVERKIVALTHELAEVKAFVVENPEDHRQQNDDFIRQTEERLVMLRQAIGGGDV